MVWRREIEEAYDDEVIGDNPLPALFEEAARRNRDAAAQRYKGGIYERSLMPGGLAPAPPGSFGSLTYGELRHIVRRLAAGLRDLGVTGGDRVAIHAETRMEWAQSDLAVLAAGGAVTTVYANASASMIAYQLADAGATGVIAENEERIERVLSVAEETSISFVISMDALETVDPPAGVEVLTLGELYERGSEVFDRETYEQWVEGVEPTDLATLLYTSGTTGRPKGVQLTHANIRANINQIRKRYGPRPDKDPEDPVIDERTTSVSFLPLAHIFERTAGHFTMIAAGGTIAYAESPDTLREDFQAIRPTVATSVPRVYEKIYAAIKKQAESSAVKARIFHWAVGVGQAHHRVERPGASLRAQAWLADRLVFGKVKEGLGGNLEMLISGGGTLSSDLCALYHGMGVPIYEGYGLTETSPVVTCNPVEAAKIGTIGPPVVNQEIEIDEGVAVVDDLAEDQDTVGELLVRGPNVSEGYWNRPEETADAFTEDGWFRTGDIVRQSPDEYLTFIERRKEVMVLSTGKNVAPGPIEAGFAASDYVEQCMVVGEGKKFVGALIVPNEPAIREWAADSGIVLPEDSEALCRHERVHALVQQEVDSVNDAFEDYETIKRFELVPREFTEENDMLTPTLKKKRRNIAAAWEERIESIYE